MNLDAVVKVISLFRENAQDVLKLIQNSQTAHKESKLVTKMLLFPFLQLPGLIQHAKVVKGSIAVQGALILVLGYLGFSINQEELPNWSYLVLFGLWYLLNVGYGFFAMQKLSKDNPFFFYKMLATFQPALYKAFEELAKSGESFEKLYDDVKEGRLKLDLLSPELLAKHLQTIEDNFSALVNNQKEKRVLSEKRFKSLFEKYSKSIESCLTGQTTLEDLNLASTPFIVYKETNNGFERVTDSTSKNTVRLYQDNFFTQYPYITDVEEADTVIFDENGEEEFFTYILDVDGCKWIITYFNENNSVISEFFVGYVIPEERLINLLKNVIRNL